MGDEVIRVEFDTLHENETELVVAREWPFGYGSFVLLLQPDGSVKWEREEGR